MPFFGSKNEQRILPYRVQYRHEVERHISRRVKVAQMVPALVPSTGRTCMSKDMKLSNLKVNNW